MITKSDFLVYLEAPRHFWALKHDQYDLTLSEFDKHLIEQGYTVETKAREYAEQFLLPNYSPNPNDLIFQKTCADGDFEARADILIRDEITNKWDIYEVKSTTKPEPEHYYDATFQSIVFEKEYEIDKVFILHVNNDYIRDGDFSLELFLTPENVTKKVSELKEDTLNKMKECLYLSSTDNYKLATHCYKPKECRCKSLCFPNLPDDSIYNARLKPRSSDRGIKSCTIKSRKASISAYPDRKVGVVDNLSRVTERKILDLLDIDVLDIKDVPDDYSLSINQKVQVEVAKRNNVLVNKKAIKHDFESLEYPLYFLDYETYESVIPVYDGYKPYQQMVFQYSLHVIESPECKDITAHHEFIAKTQDEPCRELLMHMKQHIGDTGSVIVWYKAFECTRNKEMAVIYPEFAEFLEDINSRVYDLMDIFKNNYYVDPLFMGSNSIKSVLPVLIPELNYKDLTIQDGTMAMTNWQKMIYGDLGNNEKAKILKNLLTYCERDTLAMVKIWEYLKEVVK